MNGPPPKPAAMLRPPAGDHRPADPQNFHLNGHPPAGHPDGAHLDVDQVPPADDAPPPPEPSDDEAPPRADGYFHKGQLLAAAVASEVRRQLPVRHGIDGQTWVYAGGVWLPDTKHRRIIGVLSQLLEDRYRRSHLPTVIDILTAHDPDRPEFTGDPVPRFINTISGLLDWRTGEVQPHRPDVASTVQLPVAWNPDARCPRFDRFLTQVLKADCIEHGDDNGEPVSFIWELLGYLIFSGNPFHTAVLLHAPGRNGKGTLLRVVRALIGEGGTPSVTLHDLVSNRFKVSKLFGAIANIAGDLDGSGLESTAIFKAITGGDTVSGEHKYGAIYDFAPWAVPLFSTNTIFGTPDSSEGYFSRWIVVPFPNTFTGDGCDPGLTDKLTVPAELEGILAKAVPGLRALMARGRFHLPPSVREAKDDFVAKSDPMQAWRRDSLQAAPGMFTSRSSLKASWVRWCRDNEQDSTVRGLWDFVGGLPGVGPRTQQGVRGFSGIAATESAGE